MTILHILLPFQMTTEDKSFQMTTEDKSCLMTWFFLVLHLKSPVHVGIEEHGSLSLWTPPAVCMAQFIH